MDEMPNAAETIERLAREAEDRKILQLARECETLEELVKKLEAMTEA